MAKPVKVAQLNRYIKQILTSDPILTNVSVIGEISNIKYHSTGHVYFTLKDETSKVSCFLPADVLRHIRYELEDGMEIIAIGYVSIFERGGTYSLNIKDIELTGIGNLAAAFERLKAKLAAEGLFDESLKKPLPEFPEKVAIVTSATGAAVQDITKIIKSRNNYVDIFVYPVLVQGPGAAPDIAAAIADINRRFPETDVMIVGRGGGSMEELWAFNEEIVARAIHESLIPVISAVGHETDFTISDFVADRRAETPTAAAVMAVPDIGELKKYIASLKDELLRTLKHKAEYKTKLLEANSPEAMLLYIKNKIMTYEMRIKYANSQLQDLNPANIIERGFAAIVDENGKLISSADRLDKGDKFTAVFRDGKVKAEVLERGGN
ncbi:MAG: exodeoxyribonuclease VII large subunit [Clostridiales bacterium]|nr:exodeoxyribonuclease VII large subunit [Clostridiales bacterium]